MVDKSVVDNMNSVVAEQKWRRSYAEKQQLCVGPHELIFSKSSAHNGRVSLCVIRSGIVRADLNIQKDKR